MPIEFTQGAPELTGDHLSGWLSPLRDAASRASGLAPDLLGDEYEVSDGFQVRYLDPGQLLSQGLNESTGTRRWRYLVSYEGQVLGEIELDDTGDNPVAFHEGAAKDGFLTVLDQIESMQGDFEASVLSAPALKFVGVWLQGDAGEWIIPYPPNATRLPNYQRVPVQDAIAELQEIAKDVADRSEGEEATGG